MQATQPACASPVKAAWKEIKTCERIPNTNLKRFKTDLQINYSLVLYSKNGIRITQDEHMKRSNRDCLFTRHILTLTLDIFMSTFTL